jgi:4'-phosphopantetheinyl transferase
MTPSVEQVCQVWWATPRSARPRHRQLLDDDEADRWRRFRHVADADRMLVGVALAKTVVAALLGTAAREVVFDRTCARCGAPHGKPRLVGADGPVHFSTSHSGQLVGVAVSTQAPVGVDVERLAARRHLEATARGVLTEQEFRAWTALPPARRGPALVLAWTRKESLLKATGHGLGLPLDRLGLAERDGRAELVDWPAEVPRPAVRLHDLDPGPGYLACLAVLDERPVRVSEHDGDGLLRTSPDPGRAPVE